MQAVIEKHDVLNQVETAPKPIFGAGSMDLPDEVQDALDHLIAYYKANAMRPRYEVKGNPMDIVTSLIKQVRQNLSEAEDKHAKTLLDYMIQDIVDYARATGSSYLSLVYHFDRGGREVN